MAKIFSFSLQAMGGPGQLKFEAESESTANGWAEIAIAEIDRLEKKYSRYRDDSVTSLINSQGSNGLVVDPETAGLIDYADQVYLQSDRLFDITSGLLGQIWDFRANSPPPAKDIDQIMSRIGWDKVEWKSPRIEFTAEGMQVDFGGYVKEYAADAAASACRDAGASAGLIELGGDIAVIGPAAERQGWPIGIRNPRSTESALARVNLVSGGLASSGDYERCFVLDGRRYSHILNPLNGWPVESFASVSVVADHCILAGTLSTVGMLKGEEAGLDWLRESQVPYCCITQSGEIISTPEFERV